ncbi:uncharacterized protein MEPE_06263 [Melanopsichium pennsylvanicum]|uniref:Uncharacterized protein n=2 Tax=Melanopsichium pennsylvanicum TaxID=63383 RepID=A0AAJ5C8G8_9BASI|nr:conserved hypothetical protein [Melanopsichium pennsylvanicum 4]SNX87553.1 uncharacterized protein MEPE_06263 [Melanopsichium pennsylvanicum]
MSISSASVSHSSIPAKTTFSTSSNQLYALASRVPLIKSPSLSLPTPVKLPPDLHPLPTDISAYFVYPFSLESYVLDPNTPSSSTIDHLLAKHNQYLENRQREKQQHEQELLRKVAPGWHQGDVLLPSAKAARPSPTPTSDAPGGGSAEGQAQLATPNQPQERTPLDDLADHLAQLDAMNANGAASHGL